MLAELHELEQFGDALEAGAADDAVVAASEAQAQAFWTIRDSISAAERASGVIDNKNLAWRLRDHALFVCYAPYDRPRYAMALIVEHGGGGSAAAAPIARDILLQALCNGTPPLEAYPAEQRTAIEEQRKTMVKLPTTDPAAPPRPSDTRA